MRFEATILLKTKEVGWERTQIRTQFGAVFGLNWLDLGPLETWELETGKTNVDTPRLTNEAGMSFRINRYSARFVPLVPI